MVFIRLRLQCTPLRPSVKPTASGESGHHHHPGIAQIYARRDVSRRQKFRFDRLYVRRQSMFLDLRLIVLSFWITARGTWEAREKKF